MGFARHAGLLDVQHRRFIEVLRHIFPVLFPLADAFCEEILDLTVD
jgi:hypothetical protein